VKFPILIAFCATPGISQAVSQTSNASFAAEAVSAEKAASLMNFNSFKPDTDEQRAFASQLPRDRVFGSGKAFVPFVSSGDYERRQARTTRF
jgi:hypothetical protein